MQHGGLIFCDNPEVDAMVGLLSQLSTEGLNRGCCGKKCPALLSRLLPFRAMYQFPHAAAQLFGLIVCALCSGDCMAIVRAECGTEGTHSCGVGEDLRIWVLDMEVSEDFSLREPSRPNNASYGHLAKWVDAFELVVSVVWREWRKYCYG